MTYKIAFVGPPSSGKSTTFDILKHRPHAQNIHIVFLSEIATTFMDWPEYIASHDNPLVRQYYIMKTQMMLEDLAMQEAAHSDKDAVLIICDRAVIDVFVYLNEEDAAQILAKEDTNNFGERYDYVMYFEPTGEEQFLSRNNPARIEKDYDEIKKMADRTLNAWKAHCNRTMIPIPPADTIEHKAADAAKKINELLGIEVWKID